MSTSKSRGLLIVPIILSAACFDDEEYPLDRPPGLTQFDSPLGSGGNARFAGAEDKATPPDPAESLNPGSGEPRLIEEGDIVKLEGTTLYVLNRHRGLQVVDLSNPRAPRLMSAARFYGSPLELYVREDRAYALVAGEQTWGPCAACEGGVAAFTGSKLHVVDVSSPNALEELATLEILGDVTDSRLDGDILYVVSHQYAYGYVMGGGVAVARDAASAGSVEDKTFIASFSIADPAHPVEVARLEMPREGWEDHLNVSQSAIFVASSSFGAWEGVGECAQWAPCTRLTYVDIRDPNGAITLRSSVVVPGYVQDRWQLDFDEARGILRIVLADLGWGMPARGPELRTFTVGEAAIEPLGSLEIPLENPESTTAVRFDGDRAYIVTFLRIDPLFAIDLSNPALPVLRGSLESPGWLDYIEPRGDRLIALGHDQDQSGAWKLQVSLYDVSALEDPLLIARSAFGEDWGWTPGERDDFQKVFRVADELGLIAVPFTSWRADGSGWWGRMFGNVQLLDFTHDTLALRGRVEQNGYTERALVLSENELIAVSSEVLDVIDIQDRDQPLVKGTLELARNVADISVEGSVAVEYCGDWYSGTTSLDVVAASSPNAEPPLAKLEFPWPSGQMFGNGSFVYVVSDGFYTSAGDEISPRVTIVDVSEASTPVIRGTLDLPDGMGGGSMCRYAVADAAPTAASGVGQSSSGLAMPMQCGYSRELVQMDGSYLAVHRQGRCTEYDPVSYECVTADPNRIFFVDLGDPDAPRISGRLDLGTSEWMFGLSVQGRMLYLTHYEPHVRDGEWWARYYLDRVDASNPAAPVLLPKINIPGQFVGSSADHRYVYTREDWYTTDRTVGLIHALEVFDGYAMLRGSIAFEGYLSSVALAGETAYATLWRYDESRLAVASHLAAVDLRDPDALAATQTALPPLTGYSWWGSITASGAHVLIASWGGVLVYDATDPLQPEYRSYERTEGYSSRIELADDVAYVPSGWYGVARIPL